MIRVTYSRLEEILVCHDSRFVISTMYEVVDGNEAEKKELRHRMLHHPDIEGSSRHLPIPFDGDDEPIGVRTLNAIVRRFKLPSDFFDNQDQDGGPRS